jgi:transcriptional accessory protein Tex/SPT6
MPNHAEQLAQELNLSVKNVQGAIELIDQGNTIPFIARYRKEATGSMDDQVLRDLGDRLEYLRGLDKRKEEVTSSITEQGAMTPELTAALTKAKTLAEVEDLYRPYKPKRKTRASIAKARGLQPLADAIFKQDAAFDGSIGRSIEGRVDVENHGTHIPGAVENRTAAGVIIGLGLLLLVREAFDRLGRKA